MTVGCSVKIARLNVSAKNRKLLLVIQSTESVIAKANSMEVRQLSTLVFDVKARALLVSMALNVTINATAKTTRRVIHQPANVSVSAVGWEELVIRSAQMVITVRIVKKDVLRTCHQKQLAITSLASLSVGRDTLD